MEFLLYQGAKGGPRMTWDEASAYIPRLREIFPWCRVLAFLVAGHHILKQAKHDTADNFWYRHEMIQEWIAVAEYWKKNKKKGIKRVEETPKPRGRGMTWHADKLQAQRILQYPHCDMLVMAA